MDLVANVYAFDQLGVADTCALQATMALRYRRLNHSRHCEATIVLGTRDGDQKSQAVRIRSDDWHGRFIVQ